MKKTLGVLLVVLILAAGTAFLWSCGGGGSGGDSDLDQDGYDASVDCDDSASSCTDDCVSDVDGDGVPDCLDLCIDTDLDGYGTDNSSTVVGSGSDDVGSCTSDGSTPCAGGGALCLGLDCNDDPSTGGSINPGAAELCDDGLDNNCNGLIDCYDDVICAADGACTACTDGDGDGYLAIDALCSGGDDCDDLRSDINPGGEGVFGCPARLCTPCVTDADCGTGNRCINLDGSDVCVADCSGDTLCPEGFTCSDIGGGDLQCVPSSNSCDCLPENDGETRACSSSNVYGTCTGEETCDPVTGWSVCTAATPEAETCDGLDNDCDQASPDGTDDQLLGTGCDGGDSDLCLEGIYSSCTGGVLVCSDSSGDSVEACDGVDNDCDGSTDEEFSAGGSVTYTDLDGTLGLVLGDSCGRGSCAGGTVVCSAGGAFLTCTTLVNASTETCDGIDNDCDGVEDNDPVVVPCDYQMGVCTGSLTTTCEGGTWTQCGAAEFGPSYEATENSCDGLDNDCDGQTDEDLIALLCPNQAGVCVGSRATCGGGSGWLECGVLEYGSDYEASELTCDGLDNDCDGATDEGNPGGGGSCDTGNAGVCAPGTYNCIGGALQCDQINSPSSEVCNGLDDDCDGTPDDGDPGGGGSCDGLDADLCAEGTLSCSSGSLVCSDNTGDNVEACNGIDDDCDGATDEGNPGGGGSCDGLDADLCAEGSFVCSSGSLVCSDNTGDNVEVCNSLDDDCDGATDEGLICP